MKPGPQLFSSNTAWNVWRESWCDRCFAPDEVEYRERHRGPGCPIRKRATMTQRKPPEWDRNHRAQTMDAAYKCNAFLDQPPVARRGVSADATMSMFDVEPTDHRPLVPVDGWPDYQTPDRKPTKEEHA